MKVNDLLKNLKLHEVIIIVLSILYIISGVHTSYELSPYINNIFTYLSFIALLILLFLYKTNWLLLFILVVVGLVFFSRSQLTNIKKQKNTESNKLQKMNTFNEHLKKKTLEEEIVGNINNNIDNVPNPSSYNPVMCDSHNAANL